MFTVKDLFKTLEELRKKYEEKCSLGFEIFDGGLVYFSIYPLEPKEGKLYYRFHISFTELFQSKAGPDLILEYKIQHALKALETLENE